MMFYCICFVGEEARESAELLLDHSGVSSTACEFGLLQ